MSFPRMDDWLAGLTMPELAVVKQCTLAPGDVLVTCAGFEDRAFEYLRRSVAAGSRGFRIVAFHYEPVVAQNRRAQLEALASAAGIGIDWITYDRANPADPTATVLGVGGDGRFVVEISGMSRLLVVQLLCGLLREGRAERTALIYAEALEYPPAEAEVEPELKLADERFGSIHFISSGVFEIISPPELSAVSMYGQPIRLVAFPSFNPAQLAALRNEIPASSVTVVNGRPPNPDNQWRLAAIRKLNRIPGDPAENEMTTSTLDYRETVRLLLDIYRSSGDREKIVVSPTGSKMQSVAVAIVVAAVRDLQVVYPAAESFPSPDRYTSGVRELYHLDLGFLASGQIGSELRFSRIYGKDVTPDLLRECADLYSGHYGTWAADHEVPKLRGRPISLSPDRIASYLTSDRWIATARTSTDVLIGYAIAAWIKFDGAVISWVTQLVVHREYRNKLVGSRLMNSVWGYSDHVAWGLASASPYAIRALEKVTRRRCQPSEILQQSSVRDCALASVDYLRDRPTLISETQSVIDTAFCQDLSELPSSLTAVQASGEPWTLGDLPPCQEWLGMTFRGQKAREWTEVEFNRFLRSSSEVVIEAYERMAAADPQGHHAWAKPAHAAAECAYLARRMELAGAVRILDFGCGAGRHSLEFARMGFDVTGVDRSASAISRAQEATAGIGDNRPRFVRADIFQFKDSGPEYDVGLCVYDVVGSYPDDASNHAIVDALLAHVRPGGWVVISVMAYEYVAKDAKMISEGDAQRLLAELPPSTLMEVSGEVFDTTKMIVDKQLHLIFRKEQFQHGTNLPTELLVADRRYTFDDLTALCAGRIDVEGMAYVSAGHFELLDNPGDVPLKEILLIGRKKVSPSASPPGSS